MATNEEINSAAKRSNSWIKARQSKHQEMMLDAIKVLQDNILDLSRQLSIGPDGVIEGPHKNWSVAQKIHEGIIRDFQDEFNSEAKKVTDDFIKANDDVRANYNTLNESIRFTSTNKEMFSALRDGYYQDYLAVGSAAQEKITKAVYNHVIGGGSFSTLESSIRQALLGSKAKSVTGRSLATYSKLYARDFVMNYHNDVMQTKARDLGMEYFKYIGTIMSRSRRFCIQRVGKTFSKKEIMSWNQFNWAGKSGPPLSHRGGYNCRHHWQPVRPEWLTPSAQDEIDSLNKLDSDGNIIKEQIEIKTPPNVKVNIRDTVSASFGNKATKIIDNLPDKIKNTLAANDVSIEISHHLSEVYPELKGITPRGWAPGTTWDAAEGLYHGTKKQVGCSEFVKYAEDMDWQAGRSPKDVLPHEIGHAFDDTGVIKYSASSDFKKAYKKDLKRIEKEKIDTTQYYYFLQSGDVGRSELFAEGFSNLYGGNLATHLDLPAVFPESIKQIKQIVKEL